ncbi:hypothetical protein KUTeg_018694 [Tegillarca granosa]|uniref:Ion transport domain-containing protein n=1 Tax=Tegillarca granosa TaxID=220873 RepID=A0ABQ9EEK1_TEGGR|nr:hypothetical protein KUTeg_018694 [Tegillarca granosa]
MDSNEHRNKTVSDDVFASLKPEVETIDQTTYTKVHTYAAYIVDSLRLKYRYDKKGLEILHYFDMLRVLRILRVVQNLAAIRVLRFTLKTNRRDLYVLGLYLFVGVVLFANFVYFAEETKNISSIPDAWWWSVITMTTVGYGDVVPRSPTGKIIGMFCALSGVLLLGLVVPMFVNTFLSLYKVAQLNERILKTKAKRKRAWFFSVLLTSIFKPVLLRFHDHEIFTYP